MINRNSLIECVYFFNLLCRLLIIRVNKALSVTFLIANSCSGVQNISLDACPAVRQMRKMQLNYRLRDSVYIVGYVVLILLFQNICTIQSNVSKRVCFAHCCLF